MIDTENHQVGGSHGVLTHQESRSISVVWGFSTYFDDEWGVKMGLVFLEDSSSGIKYLIWYQVVESSCKSFYKPPKHTYIQSP